MRTSPILVARLTTTLCLLGCLSATAFAAGDGSGGDFKLLKALTVGGEGRWDYITIDPQTHRLYVPRSNHTQVLNADSGKVEADWSETNGVHGVALVSDKGLAFTSNGRSGNVSVFDTKTNQKITDVKAGTGPDAIVYDDASGRVLVMNHRGGTITLISISDDGKQFTPQELEVGGTLEFAAVDGAGHAFVNVEDKSEVVQIDTRAAKVLNHWPLTGGEGPTGLAIDSKHNRLFVGCGGNDKMIVMDSGSGAILATLPIGSRCDGCAFDPGSGEAFAACGGGDGTIAVVREVSDGKFEVAQTVKTMQGARTICVDPQSHTLYLPTAEFEASSGTSRPSMKSGSFQIVVVGK
jgi:YVTN family beta-propeller protein